MNDTIKSSALNTYLKRLKKACPRKVGDKLASDLNDSLYNYLDCNPDATYADLEREFGSPSNFASEYLKSMDNEELAELTNKSGWIKKCIFITTMILVITIIIAGIFIVHKNSKSADYSHTIIIEYGTTSTLN